MHIANLPIGLWIKISLTQPLAPQFHTSKQGRKAASAVKLVLEYHLEIRVKPSKPNSLKRSACKGKLCEHRSRSRIDKRFKPLQAPCSVWRLRAIHSSCLSLGAKCKGGKQ